MCVCACECVCERKRVCVCACECVCVCVAPLPSPLTYWQFDRIHVFIYVYAHTQAKVFTAQGKVRKFAPAKELTKNARLGDPVSMPTPAIYLKQMLGTFVMYEGVVSVVIGFEKNGSFTILRLCDLKGACLYSVVLKLHLRV